MCLSFLECEPHEGRDCVCILTVLERPTTGEALVSAERYFRDKTGAQRRDAFFHIGLMGKV
jgi:hypothetical protein